MPRLNIMRPKETINRYAKYNIFLNGKPLGKLRNDEILQFEIPEGENTIVAKFKWCSSNEFKIESKNETNYLKISAFKGSKWIMPITYGLAFIILISINLLHDYYYTGAIIVFILYLPFFYYLTIGRKKYLFIEENTI